MYRESGAFKWYVWPQTYPYLTVLRNYICSVMSQTIALVVFISYSIVKVSKNGSLALFAVIKPLQEYEIKQRIVTVTYYVDIGYNGRAD